MSQSYRLIILEDEPQISKGLTGLSWVLAGVDLIKTFRTGEELISEFSSINPDIALCDINLPGLSGIETARQIQSLKPELKVIFLTGYNDFQYAQSAVNLHAFAFILKPADPDELINTVQKARIAMEKDKAHYQHVHNLKKTIDDLSGTNPVLTI
ncbi:MAG: response regulator [Spirochaetaceae bacterium]|jgi:two-component system response regulator YesN|nr:response regulator [Spirochaetaceae bacterium]